MMPLYVQRGCTGMVDVGREFLLMNNRHVLSKRYPVVIKTTGSFSTI